MTIVKKNIYGSDYYYFQDIVNKKVLTTYIGKDNSDTKQFEERRSKALATHFIKILQEQKFLDKVSYTFEHSPTHNDTQSLEMIRFKFWQFFNSLTKDEKEEFRNVLFIRHVYGTTAIEGNTYTVEETEKLLNHDLTSSNKSVKETIEIANYKDVRSFMRGYKADITERFIKNVHKLLMKGLKGRNGLPVNAGEYRTTNAKLYGIWFNTSPPELIEQRINYLISELNDKIQQSVHPVELAAIFHQKFEEIHPFEDGNGRTGREVLNYMLGKEGFPMIYFKPNEKSVYFTALEQGNKLNYVPLIDFVIYRMSATLAYLVSKTGIYDHIKSTEYRNYFVPIAGEEEYKSYVNYMDGLRNRAELP